MFKEMVKEVGLPTEPLEVGAGHRTEFLVRIRQRVQHRELHTVVALLLRVEFRRVAWQPLNAVVVGVSREKLADAHFAMRVQMIPDDEQRTPNLRAEVAQADNDLLAVNGPEHVAREQLRSAAIERCGDGDEARDFSPFRAAVQHGDAPDGGPRRPYAGPIRETCFVQEGNDPPASTSPLLMRGQSRLSHASINASLRSVARVAGRCGDQPCARNTRPSDRKW